MFRFFSASGHRAAPHRSRTDDETTPVQLCYQLVRNQNRHVISGYFGLLATDPEKQPGTILFS